MTQQQSHANFNKLFQMYSVMAQVVGAVDMTPRMRRVTLGGDGVQQIIPHCQPADAVKLYLPEPGQPATTAQFFPLPGKRTRTNIRAYTIRRVHSERDEIDIDILLHGNSAGSVWARNAQPGDLIGFIGPRHDYRGAPDAVWQLFAGDESALPAIASILEQLPANTRAYAFIEVNDTADELPIETEADVHLTWLHRGTTPPKQSRLLEQALRAFTLPADQGYCWIAGHVSAVKNIRKHLLNERRFDKNNVSTIGYWS